MAAVEETKRSDEVYKATGMLVLESTSQSKIKKVASPGSDVVCGVATAGSAAFRGNPDGLSCGDNDWTITTCKKNLNFQQAKDDAFEAVFEQVVENAGKEYVEWLIGAKPQTTGYKRMRKFLKSRTTAAEAFLKVIFPNARISFHDQAVELDHLFQARNQNQHASTFADLDRMMGRAARIINASSNLRQNLSDSCILVDKYYEGGRQMVIEGNPIAYREVYGIEMPEPNDSMQEDDD